MHICIYTYRKQAPGPGPSQAPPNAESNLRLSVVPREGVVDSGICTALRGALFHRYSQAEAQTHRQDGHQHRLEARGLRENSLGIESVGVASRRADTTAAYPPLLPREPFRGRCIPAAHHPGPSR